MSAQEILAELPKLKPAELRLVREKLQQLEVGEDLLLQAVKETAKRRLHWPDDYALNHGHYVNGEPRKT
jgi:hypothetical protein